MSSPTTPPSPPRLETLRKVAWSALTLAMFLAFLELLARRASPSPVEDPHIRMDFDADLLWGLAGERRDRPDMRVNSLGLRGDELEDVETVRILTLGDSSIYGHSVSIEEVFSSVLAEKIEAARPAGSDAPPVEPVNGAVPGYSTFQSLRQLARVKDEVRPDVVIIGNLWSDSFHSAITDQAWAAQLADTYGPWQPIVKPLALLSDSSALARVLRAGVHGTFFPAKDKALEVGWSHLVPGPEGPARPPPKYDGEGLPTTRVPLDQYQANLRTLAAEVRAIGALPAYLMLPHPLDDLPRRGVSAHEKRYRETMRAVAATEGAPLVDGPAWFVAHPVETPRFADDIHPDARGHAEIAEAAFLALSADPAFAARLGLPAPAANPTAASPTVATETPAPTP